MAMCRSLLAMGSSFMLNHNTAADVAGQLGKPALHAAGVSFPCPCLYRDFMSWIDHRPDDAAGAFEAMVTATTGSVDAATFREAMRRLGAAVHVVTTDGPGGKGGFTATAVCALSDAPAMLLVCLNRRSRSTGPFHANGVFCVNTLRADEEAIAKAFAARTA